MEPRVWRAGLVLLAVFAGMVAPGGAISEDHAASAAFCPRASAAESILRPPRDRCPTPDSLVGASAGVPDLVGVAEGDEIALQKALSLVHRSIDGYVAMLFYASWCRFSKTCRPSFNVLSSLFPTIRHFAFEESVIRPSTLSRYGVHGFPTLFLLNSTMRVRYHGSRTVNSLVAFYSDVTGIKPLSMDLLSLDKIVNPSNHDNLKREVDTEDCPLSWARSPEKLLQQETYLALATAFVLIRFFYFLLPKILACVKRAWRRHMRYASLVSLRDCSQAYLGQARQAFIKLNPYRRSSNLPGGAMNATAWASKSLASVAIGEPSSRRAQVRRDRR